MQSRSPRLVAYFLFLLMLWLPSQAMAQEGSNTDEAKGNGKILLLDNDVVSYDDSSARQAPAASRKVQLVDEDEMAQDDLNEANGEAVLAAAPSDSVIKGHGLALSMSVLGMPGGIFGSWFAEHGNHWDNGAVNMGFSLDYTLRFVLPLELRFSLAWANLRTGDAYWLRNKYSEQPQLASYVKSDHSVVSLEVTAFHIIDIIDEIAFYYGGGLWGGVVLGDGRSYAIRSECALSTDSLQDCPHEPGNTEVLGLPPVLGFVTVALGFKFTLLEILTLRTEFGFKGYLYGQVGIGVEF